MAATSRPERAPGAARSADGADGGNGACRPAAAAGAGGHRAAVRAAPAGTAAAGGAPPGLVLATRGSALALAQARLVQAALSAAEGGAAWRIMPVTTRGDRSAAPGAAGAGGGAASLAALARTSPGLFTAEVAAAVRDGAAQAAVHSLKDLPLDQPPELCLAAILPRAAAHDVLVIAPRWFAPAAPLGLRPGAAVGTSSPRRAALLRHYAPQARPTALRGNVPTRLRRCREGGVAALLLAGAGLQRLRAEVAGLRLVALPPERWAPAPGQGAVAVQARPASAAAARLAAVDHAATRAAVTLERSLLQALGGGCAAACGAYARPAADQGWILDYGFAAAGGADPAAGAGAWRNYRLRGSAADCLRAVAAWAGGGAPPGVERTSRDARWRLWRLTGT